MKELSKQILQKIKQENICPKSAWSFRLLSLLWIVLMVVAIVFGSLAIALAAFVWENQSWELLSLSQSDRLQTVLLAMPYSWCLVLLALVAMSYYYFRHIGCGYRQPLARVLAVVLALNLLGGYTFFALGWGQKIHDFLVAKSPAYEQSFDSRRLVWNRPESGLLSGRIVAIELPVFYLDDADQRQWRVLLLPETVVDNNVDILVGKKIKVLGSISGSQEFEAQQIKVWTCGCGGHCAKCGSNCSQAKEKTCH